MGPVSVVVVEVVDGEAFKLTSVPDDGAVEKLPAHGADPALSERVGRGRTDGVWVPDIASAQVRRRFGIR